MAERRKIQFQGQTVWGEVVDFEVDKEPWNVYVLHDGTTLKLKAVASEIIRLDMFTPTGDPVYLVNAAQVLAAAIPDRLKKHE